MLFNNNLISYKKKVLFFPKWQEIGLEQVKDVINIKEKRLLSLEEIQTLTGQNTANTIFEYNALINAIPRSWLEWIQKISETDSDQTRFCEASMYNTKPKDIKKILENKGRNTSLSPHACDFWRRKLGIDLTEQEWLSARYASKEVRLRELQWKINHNIYPTNILLHKMNVTDSNKCHYCKDEIDYIEHFFFDCTVARTVWTHVENKLVTLVGIIFKLDVIDVLFGVKDKKTKSKGKKPCQSYNPYRENVYKHS
jgi:hypothetical protein